MIDLAANGQSHGKVSLNHAAERQGISAKYLWQIASQLKSAGLIHAMPGACGGYGLAKSPDAITLAEILEALEGKFHLVPCVAKSSVCRRSGSCVSQMVWRELSAKINEVLTSMTLSDMMRKQADLAAGAPVAYTI